MQSNIIQLEQFHYTPQNNSRQTQIKLPTQLEEENLGHTSQVPYAITKNPIVQRRESNRKTST